MWMQEMMRRQARSWTARWRAVERIRADEIRNASMEQRLAALLACRALACSFGHRMDRHHHDRDVEVVRERWAALRRTAR